MITERHNKSSNCCHDNHRNLSSCMQMPGKECICHYWISVPNCPCCFLATSPLPANAETVTHHVLTWSTESDFQFSRLYQATSSCAARSTMEHCHRVRESKAEGVVVCVGLPHTAYMHDTWKSLLASVQNHPHLYISLLAETVTSGFHQKRVHFWR